MSDKNLTLKVVTPSEIFFEGEVNSIVAPGGEGYLGILKNHAPLVTTVGKGSLKFSDISGKEVAFKIEGGFLEVQNNQVLVLTDKVES